MAMSNNRLTEACLRELENLVRGEVERMFEARRKLPDETTEVPVIGGEYDPHAPREQHADLVGSVCRALVAKSWFEHEAPRWAQPLPLKFDDCIALFNGPNRGNRRLHLVGEYGKHLRGMDWEIQRAQPFELFCAYQLLPPPP
jgi:hypothetical protein